MGFKLALGGQSEASFVDLRGCFARETFKEVMTIALQACKRLYDRFSSMITQEVKRTHSENVIEYGSSPGELGLEKLQIYEAGDEQPIEMLNFEEYDLAFEQLISDSEDEEMD